jgi:hypothetical protein
MSTAVDFGHTDGAEWSRLEKAYTLADRLAGRGVTTATAAALSEKGRRAAERYAGVRKCSGETWDVVLARMAEHTS